jgi:hypothetical protein
MTSLFRGMANGDSSVVSQGAIVVLAIVLLAEAELLRALGGERRRHALRTVGVASVPVLLGAAAIIIGRLSKLAAG